jgi:glycosyltransferase involved in cell wall biosynthesis
MRILHITQGYSPAVGGTELLIQRVSEELTRRFGDDVAVFTTDCLNGEAFFSPNLPHLKPGWEEIGGVRVRRFPVRRRLSQVLRVPQAIAYRLRLPFNEYLRAGAGGPIVPGLRRAVAAWPCDVVAASSFPLLHMFDALAGAHAAGRPCVLHGGLHPHDDWGFQRPMIYRAIAEADAYVANTQFESDYVVSRGAAPGRVHTVGVGVDVEAYDGVTTEEAKWRMGFDKRPLVGFIGQLSGHKGLDTLLRAMPRVWQAEPELNLLVAGGRTLFTPWVERTMREWPADFQRRSRLYLNFPDDKKPWLYGAIDLLAYPSGYESFGISYLEGWAAGKPVIGARSGAVPSVIADGLDGLLIDYQDDRALARAILDLVRHPERAREMGEAGRTKTLARYTWRRVAERFREIYAAVLTRHAGTG